MTSHILASKKYIGKKYNHWTVLEYFPAHRKEGKSSRALCLCVCGNKGAPSIGDLKAGKSRSCGCKSASILHGKSQAKEYQAWVDMRNRCNNKKHKWFYRYGGRGIEVCDKWNLFANFYADMGPKLSSKHSIDRIDNDGNYEPSNCRWATHQEQMCNRSIPSSPKVRKTCNKCKKRFWVSFANRKKHKHCSYACRMTRFFGKCLTCNKEIMSTPSNIKKYCSRGCYFEARRKESYTWI